MSGESQPVLDDRLPCLDVSSYVETKHALVSLYAELFSSAMKAKWDTRVYVELYSGPGYSRLRKTGEIIPGSTVKALAVPDPFDRYIFCDKSDQFVDALKARVRRHSPSAEVRYVSGNCNEKVHEVLNAIPRPSPQNKVLTLCFVDPPDIGIKFETIRKLSTLYVDFLVLLALYMDANRNIDNYVKEEATKIDEFLGTGAWREKWRAQQLQGKKFPQFLAEEFSNSMETLGYRPQPFHKMKPVIISEVKNVQLYRLALFSRHQRAYRLWDQVLKYSTPQTEIDFEGALGE